MNFSKLGVNVNNEEVKTVPKKSNVKYEKFTWQMILNQKDYKRFCHFLKKVKTDLRFDLMIEPNGSMVVKSSE